MAKVYDTATDLITFARLQAQNTTSGSSYLGSDGLLKFAAEDEPRIEYGSDGSLKGLLIEEQRTNLVTYSEDFSHSSWSKNAYGTASAPVVTASSVTDPAGGAGAYRVELDVGSGTTSGDRSDLAISVASTQGADYTHSIWVRGDVGGEQINIRGAAQGAYQLVTLTTDWMRVTGTEAALSTLAPMLLGIRQAVNGVINSTATIHIYGAQIEAGSFATSYIPTSGSQSTRSPDIASIPVSAFGYNQDAGTVVVEAQTFSLGGTMVNICDGGAGGSIQRMQLRFSNDNLQSIFAVNGLANGITSVSNPFNANTFYRAAWSFDGPNSLVTAGEGGVSSPDTSHDVPRPVEMRIGRLGQSGSPGQLIEPLNGHIKSIQYYPRRLTNTQLQELTA